MGEMKDILSTFTVVQIITFVIMVVLAIKGVQDIVDYFRGKYTEQFNRDHERIVREQELESHYEACKRRHDETLALYNKVNEKLDKLSDSIKELDDRVGKLTISDRNDIRQFIVREYHYFTEQKGWIDDYSLDSLLQRYEDYKEEGGNSYIHTLIEEIKKLPKTPPEDDNDN